MVRGLPGIGVIARGEERFLPLEPASTSRRRELLRPRPRGQTNSQRAATWANPEVTSRERQVPPTSIVQ